MLLCVDVCNSLSMHVVLLCVMVCYGVMVCMVVCVVGRVLCAYVPAVAATCGVLLWLLVLLCCCRCCYSCCCCSCVFDGCGSMFEVCWLMCDV